MLRGPFLDRSWMAQNPDYEKSDIVMLGLPFGGTVSYRPGSRFAPEQIRLASWGLEEYSPVFDKELSDVNFHDAGDLEFPLGNTYKTLEQIEQNVEDIYKDGKRVFGIGGEHLVAYPEAGTAPRAVIRHISKFVKPENIKQIGIRSGMKEEWDFMKEHNTLCHKYSDLDSLKGKNVFITVDLDCLDTSIMPGTGTPEVGGMSFDELLGWFKYLKDFNIVGADVVELAPDYDPTGASTAVATKVIRELLMIM